MKVVIRLQNRSCVGVLCKRGCVGNTIKNHKYHNYHSKSMRGVREYIILKGGKKVPVVTMDKQNRIYIPKEVLKFIGGHNRFVLMCEGGKIILIPEKNVLEDL